jgi:hypothetical protein
MACGPTPTQIDDPVAQNAKEPGNHPLVAPQLTPALDGLRVGILQDFLGQRRRADPSFEETLELPAVLKKRARCFGGELCVRLPRCLLLAYHRKMQAGVAHAGV